jgi:hypothetical protein
MTVPRISAVGFCAHYSRVGDWAFDYALRLAQSNALQLNAFHFLDDPYDPNDASDARYSKQELADLAFEKERELRVYYDERAGEYVNVGFRLCFDESWRELHRCLMGREFQVLVLARPEVGAQFAGWPIEEFAHRFVSPVVLVGPDHPEQFLLNSRAALLVDRLGIPDGQWERVSTETAPA